MAFHWTCPYCDRDTTITDTYSTDRFDLEIENAVGGRRFKTLLIVCPNKNCRQFTLSIDTYHLLKYASGTIHEGERIATQRLIPPSNAKTFPGYVPQPIRDDYVEGCNIRELSPKASATLSRRCLQGMIRDFWGIKERRLIDEINALKGKVDDDTWIGIDAIRSIGNIGAHMEQDINVIVDVEPEEAQLLIGLIEMLVKDWYITREQRKQRLEEIKQLRDAKDAAKKGSAKTP